MSDQVPVQEDQRVFIKRPGQDFKQHFLLTILVLLFGFFLGFLSHFVGPLSTLTPPFAQKTTIPSPTLQPQGLISVSQLPINPELLKNQIVYEWRGSVRGRLTQKDEHTWTLVDEKGNSITITDVSANGDIFKTRFFEKVDDGNQRQITLNEIALDSTLMGDFFIF